MTPAARKAAFKARQERIIATQSRPGLTACERLVIAIIGQHENLETGQCDPGIETIAKEGGLYERAVYRAIAGAERNGALAITRTGSGGRNGRNSYRLCGGNPDKSAGLNPDKRTLTKRSKNPDKCAPELTELPPPEEPLGSSSGGRGESEQPSAAFPPPPGAGGLVGPAPEEDQQEGAPSPSVEIQPQSKPDSRKNHSRRCVAFMRGLGWTMTTRRRSRSTAGPAGRSGTRRSWTRPRHGSRPPTRRASCRR